MFTRVGELETGRRQADDDPPAIFGVGLTREPPERFEAVDGERHPAAAAPEQITEPRGRAAMAGGQAQDAEHVVVGGRDALGAGDLVDEAGDQQVQAQQPCDQADIGELELSGP